MRSVRAVVLVVVCALALGGGGAAAAPDPAYGPAFTRAPTIPWAVVVDSQGRSVVSGFDGFVGFVERFTPSGHPDTTFGVGGVVSFPSQIPSVAVDLQNRVLVGGGNASGSLVVW